MSLALVYKLFAIVLTVAMGWVVGKMRWLGDEKAEPARVLSNAAFYLFAPALLFRTTSRVDLPHLPWGMLAAFFIPVLLTMFGVYFWQQAVRRKRGGPVAGPAVRAITVTFGNSVQIGIPLAAALYGEAGLGLHLTLVSLHGLVLLAIVTTLVELDLARHQASSGPAVGLLPMLASTFRNTVIHPVTLPVIAGLLWNVGGLPLPAPVDEVLQLLGSAVVPLCLTLIGMSLAYMGLPRPLHGALLLAALKLLLAPALTLLLAKWVFGLSGLPLAVVVLMASLPTGSNALMFAQRYRALEAETTAATVLSTLLVVVNVPLWLAVLQWVG